MTHVFVGAAVIALAGAVTAAAAEPPDGAAIFKTVCATCHDAGPAQRAPTLDSLRLRTPRSVMNAMLLSNAMRVVTTRLTNDERRAVAEFVTGKKLGDDPAGSTMGRCGTNVPMSDVAKAPQ